MISIPTSFKLGGRDWTVCVVPTVDNDVKVLGMTDSDDAIIYVREGLKTDLFRHTFYHELCHAICFSLGWSKLNGDEDKIDALASCLLQFLKTKRGTTSPS